MNSMPDALQMSPASGGGMAAITAAQRRRNGRSRELFGWARVIHIYLSSLLFGLLLLFCVTGIALNHVAWLDGGREGDIQIALPQAVAQRLQQSGFDAPPLNEITSLLRRRFNLRQATSVTLDDEAGEIIFDYQLPAGYASAIVTVDNAVLQLQYRNGTWLNLLGDLHKGRHSGSVWSWLIDGSAALMLLFALTGLVILLQNRRHRQPALACAMFGLLTPWLLYLCCVPHLTGVQ